MGKRAVQVSNQLWQQILTVGWRAGDKAIVECIEGLPEDAVFYDVEYRGGFEVLHFVFEHPDWPEADSDANIPVMHVVYRNYYDGARKAAEAVMARCGSGQQDRYGAKPVSIEELTEVIRVALEDCRE